MPREPIPEDLRRFILTSVPSVPFVVAYGLIIVAIVDKNRAGQKKR